VTRPILLLAFYGAGSWHVWDAFVDDSRNFYKVADNRSELFKLVYSMGYELKAVDSVASGRTYFFQLRDDGLLQDVNEYEADAEKWRAEQRAGDE
jgi:hypothetical protein